MIDWILFWDAAPYLVRGALATLYITALSTLLSMALGLLLAVARMSRRPWLRVPAIAYIDFMRGVPLLVLLLFIYFALPPTIGIDLSPFAAGIIGLGTCGAAYTAEIFRGGIMSVPHGQIEAAQSLGMGYWKTMRIVVLPQALRVSVPALTNEWITLLKDSSLVSVIGMEELVRRGQFVISRTFDAFTPLLLVALIYLVLTYGSSFILNRLEKRLSYD